MGDEAEVVEGGDEVEFVLRKVPVPHNLLVKTLVESGSRPGMLKQAVSFRWWAAKSSGDRGDAVGWEMCEEFSFWWTAMAFEIVGGKLVLGSPRPSLVLARGV